jgi:hypothetical protein
MSSPDTASFFAMANTASEIASRRVMGSRRAAAPAAWTGAVLLAGVLPRSRAIGQRIASSCRVRL